MPRTGGWRREGSRGRFRYFDARGERITDTDKIERIKALVIPPAWKDVWISPRPGAKLQATGVDAAGRKQYLYHATFRAQQDQAKFDRLILFAERLPELRAAMAEHMDNELLDRGRVSAVATRLVNRAWFRVGSERYAKESKTFGITTLNKSHVRVRGKQVAFRFRGKHRVEIRTTLVDAELAEAMKELLTLPAGGGSSATSGTEASAASRARASTTTSGNTSATSSPRRTFARGVAPSSPRSPSPSAGRSSPRPRQGAQWPRRCGESASSSGTRPRSRAARTSVRP